MAAAAAGGGDGLVPGSAPEPSHVAQDGDLKRHIARDPARGLDVELDLRRDIRAAGSAALPTREPKRSSPKNAEVAERAEVEARRRKPRPCRLAWPKRSSSLLRVGEHRTPRPPPARHRARRTRRDAARASVRRPS
jgi:hypothetical protein